MSAGALPPAVVRLSDCDANALARLFADFGLVLRTVAPHAAIPGSYWGESEAGLIANQVYVRPDTPLHSACHEASHAIVMGEERRRTLAGDAGGDHAEEDAVCYLQVLLADELPGYGRAAMWRDMDAWGYTFRLGDARSWFERDAAEAHAALVRAGLATGGPEVRLRRPAGAA